MDAHSGVWALKTKGMKGWRAGEMIMYVDAAPKVRPRVIRT